MNAITLDFPASMEPHIQRIMNGEYNVAYEHPAPLILDIGANVGAFALWALQRWPGSFVHSYEPHPETFGMLMQNVGRTQRVACHEVAVLNGSERRHLHDGLHNCGEASLWNIGEQNTTKGHSVRCEPTHKLPDAQILKIDTEGSEGLILEGLAERDCFDAVLFEYHSDALRRECDGLLKDYVLVGASRVSNHSIGQRGTLKYLHKRLMAI